MPGCREIGRAREDATDHSHQFLSASASEPERGVEGGGSPEVSPAHQTPSSSPLSSARQAGWVGLRFGGRAWVKRSRSSTAESRSSRDARRRTFDALPCSPAGSRVNGRPPADLAVRHTAADVPGKRPDLTPVGLASVPSVLKLLQLLALHNLEFLHPHVVGFRDFPHPRRAGALRSRDRNDHWRRRLALLDHPRGHVAQPRPVRASSLAKNHKRSSTPTDSRSASIPFACSITIRESSAVCS